ncbi:MAG TPA: DUF5709 domain-containing protein [Kineosporiaceae bacterium]|nr:DUF5709 domain-containing protein [Kineosporiaceae bacterium]
MSEGSGGGFTGDMGEPDLDAREADEAIDTDVAFGDRGTDEELDRSYSPPERPRALDAYGTTLAEQRAGETLDQRLAQEEPDPALEVGPPDMRDPPPDMRDPESGLGEPTGDPAGGTWGEPLGAAAPRSGRLVAPDEGLGPDEERALVARDVGIDAGAATAEEAAVHVVDDGEGQAIDEGSSRD